MKQVELSDNLLALAHELADLYNRMDTDCRAVSNMDIERLYAEKEKNPVLHYKALEINRYRKHRD